MSMLNFSPYKHKTVRLSYFIFLAVDGPFNQKAFVTVFSFPAPFPFGLQFVYVWVEASDLIPSDFRHQVGKLFVSLT